VEYLHPAPSHSWSRVLSSARATANLPWGEARALALAVGPRPRPGEKKTLQTILNQHPTLLTGPVPGPKTRADSLLGPYPGPQP
jgi:hypothetical protein